MLTLLIIGLLNTEQPAPQEGARCPEPNKLNCGERDELPIEYHKNISRKMP